MAIALQGFRSNGSPKDSSARIFDKTNPKLWAAEADETGTVVLAEQLGCLPLALEQAGAYIAKHRVDISQYLKLLAESRAELFKFPSRGGTGYQQTVATTWLVTAERLGLPARLILQLSSFLASDDIPRSLFTSGSELLKRSPQTRQKS